MASTFLRHVACPDCGSSDGASLYSDGHTFCFVCNAHSVKSAKFSAMRTAPSGEPVKVSEPISKIRDVTPVTDVFRELKGRKISQEAVQKYLIDVNTDSVIDVAHRYPYFKKGQHVGNKVRRRSEKAFWWEGDPKSGELFGQSVFPAASAKSITIVEGELDAASAWMLLGSRYPVVSVKSASSAVADCKASFEYLDSFEDIVICFDADAGKTGPDGVTRYPGQEAAQKVAELFKPGKCRILTLQNGKDPNDYLVNGVEPKIFVSEWWKAQRFSPAGLIPGRDMWDSIWNRPSSFAIPYPWERLNKMTYGIRLSEAVLLMADTGVGKTSIFKEIEHDILTNPEVIEKGYGVGLLHLEEPNFETGLGLISIQNNKPYHLPDTPQTEEELRAGFDVVLNHDRVIFYDHFGSNDIEEILAKVRYMSVMGCKYIFIDHLSIIVSDQSGDERKQLDEISTKLKTLTMELNIAVFCVIHTNRDGQARGSAGPEKVANIHLSLHRAKKDPDEWRRNVLKIEIEKNRFSGRTGPCLWLFYNQTTGRLEELDEDSVAIYEEGGTILGEAF